MTWERLLTLVLTAGSFWSGGRGYPDVLKFQLCLICWFICLVNVYGGRAKGEVQTWLWAGRWASQQKGH